MILPFLEVCTWAVFKLPSLEIAATLLASALVDILVLFSQGLAFTYWNKRMQKQIQGDKCPISHMTLPQFYELGGDIWWEKC